MSLDSIVALATIEIGSSRVASALEDFSPKAISEISFANEGGKSNTLLGKSKHGPYSFDKWQNPWIARKNPSAKYLCEYSALDFHDVEHCLGYQDCYHYWAWIENPGHSAAWKRAYEAKFLNKGTFTRDDWDEILGDYQALTDNPCVYFAPELIAAYPEAQVILQTRDLSSWYASFHTIIVKFCRDPVLHYLCGFDKGMSQWWPVSRKMHSAVFEGNLERDNAIAVHQRFMDKVRELVPKEKLLEWKVQDGWGPLCEFLGVKEPEEEFPRINDSKWFLGMMAGIDRDLKWKAARALAPWVMAFVVGIGAAWWALKR